MRDYVIFSASILERPFFAPILLTIFYLIFFHLYPLFRLTFNSWFKSSAFQWTNINIYAYHFLPYFCSFLCAQIIDIPLFMKVIIRFVFVGYVCSTQYRLIPDEPYNSPCTSGYCLLNSS